MFLEHTYIYIYIYGSWKLCNYCFEKANIFLSLNKIEVLTDVMKTERQILFHHK